MQETKIITHPDRYSAALKDVDDNSLDFINYCLD